MEGDFGLQLGTSVSITGDGAMLVASGVGEVLIYEYIDNKWTLRHRLKSLLTDNDGGGYKSNLSRDGSFLIIGSPQNQKKKGAVQVFCFEEDKWIQKGKTVEGDNESDDFGFDVSVANNGVKILISALGGGYARAYTYTSPQWQYTSQDNFGDGKPEFRFGYATSISGPGHYSVVGAPAFNSNIGMVEGYDLSGYERAEQISGSLSDPDAEFGTAVAIAKDAMTLAIGAPGVGIVKIYRMNNVLNKWIELDNHIHIDSGKFGSSLSIADSGTKIVVGDPENSLNGIFAGATYIFQYDPLPVNDRWVINGIWKQLGTAFYGENENDKCGTDVSLSANGNKIVSSCPGFDSQRGTVCVLMEQAEVDDTAPSTEPSMTPTTTPTMPTMKPSSKPSNIPTIAPSENPTSTPSSIPSNIPSSIPSVVPTLEPTSMPSSMPSVVPTTEPTSNPTSIPTIGPTISPTMKPTSNPTVIPSFTPTVTAPGKGDDDPDIIAILLYLIGSALTLGYGFIVGLFGDGIFALLFL